MTPLLFLDNHEITIRDFISMIENKDDFDGSVDPSLPKAMKQLKLWYRSTAEEEEELRQCKIVLDNCKRTIKYTCLMQFF